MDKLSNGRIGRCDRCGSYISIYDVVSFGRNGEVLQCLYCRVREEFPDPKTLVKCPSSGGSYNDDG